VWKWLFFTKFGAKSLFAEKIWSMTVCIIRVVLYW
jgi:hypothetical protein